MSEELLNIVNKTKPYVLMRPEVEERESINNISEFQKQLKEHILSTKKPLRVDDCNKVAFGNKLIYAREEFYKLLGALETDSELNDFLAEQGYDYVIDLRIVGSSNKTITDTRLLGVDTFTSNYSERIQIIELLNIIHKSEGVSSTEEITFLEENRSEIKAESEKYYYKLLKLSANIDEKKEKEYRTEIEQELNPYRRLQKELFDSSKKDKDRLIDILTAEEIRSKLSDAVGVEEYRLIIDELPENEYLKSEIVNFLKEKTAAKKIEINNAVELQVKNKIEDEINSYRKKGNSNINLIDAEKEWVLGALDRAIEQSSDGDTVAKFQFFYQDALIRGMLSKYGLEPKRESLFDNYTEKSETHAELHISKNEGNIDLLLSHLADGCCDTHRTLYRDLYLDSNNDHADYLVLVPLIKKSCISCVLQIKE